jgi:uncharacterized protein (DUF1015 family)
MAQLAGFRGLVWDRTKVELAGVAAAPIDAVAERTKRGELVRDPARALYRYHQTFVLGGRTTVRKTTLAAVRLEPWTEGSIRAHEATDAAALDAATRGISAAATHTAAVLAGYRDAASELDRLFKKIEADRPTLEVTTTDGTQHKLWRESSAERLGAARKLFAPKRLSVLDGHARYEGMLAYQAQVAKAHGEDRPLAMYSSANYGLFCLVNLDDPALVSVPRHRIVHQGGAKSAAVLEAAKRYFVVEKLAGLAGNAGKLAASLGDTFAHQPAFVVVFAGDPDAWKLTLSPDVSPTAEGVTAHRALQKYEPIVIEQLFFARVTPGARSVTETDPARVIAAVGGGAELGVIVRPLTIEQILHVAELGQVLPFGSTAFRPALANLVALPIEPDEDLV